MIREHRVAAAALGSILLAAGAGAQSHGAGIADRAPSAGVLPLARMAGPAVSGIAARPVVVRAAGRVRIGAGGRVVQGNVPAPNPAGFESGIGVPGLGFDYPHLAAISGGLQNGGRRGLGRGNRPGQGFIVPILYGGYPYYVDSSLDYDPQQVAEPAQGYPAQQPPQIIVIQQPVPAAALAQTSPLRQPDSETGLGQASVGPAPDAQAPAPRAGEIILIRKDGRVLFASAFSVVGAQLRYISAEGILQKFPVAELDAESTQQMNEARGNSVQIGN
jgi:hypothetical protein